jgi:hypothetical protein
MKKDTAYHEGGLATTTPALKSETFSYKMQFLYDNHMIFLRLYR